MTATPSPSQVVSNPILFAKTFLKIQDKDMRTIPLVYNHFQSDYLNKRTPRDLILKPRQLGFTTCIQAEFRRYEWTRPTRTMTLGKDDENTTDLRAMADFYYEQLPINFRPIRTINNATRTVYPEIKSRATIRTAGNRNSGRGGTNTHIHLSEAAFYPDAASIIASALQAGSPKWVVVESSPAGASGWFFDECMAALQGDSVFRLHFYRWFDNPDYAIPLYDDEPMGYSEDELRLIDEHNLSPEQINWRRFKLMELKDLFYQEYPEDVVTCFRTSGGGVFKIAARNILPKDSNFVYEDGAYYVAGLDWGQEDDFTALSIMRVKTGEAVQEVYLNRWNKQSWGSIRSRIIEQLEAWHVEKLIPERNSIGSVNIEDLVNELDDKKLGTAIQAFYTDQRSKDGLVKNMQNGLSDYGLMLLPIEYALNEMRTFMSKQSANGLYSYSHPDGGHDDTVMARMLAYYAASQLWI